MTIPKLKETSCTCKECVGMCKKRPCWGTPEEIENLIDMGFAHRLMRDYWVGRFAGYKEGDIDIISPAIVGYCGLSAPSRPTGRCTFLNNEDRCEIYKFRPVEARVASHDQEISIHANVAMEWDTYTGRRVAGKWRSEIDSVREDD